MKSLTGYVNVLTKTPNKFFILVFSPVLRFRGSGIDLGCQLGFGLRFGLGIWLDFLLGFGMDFGLDFRNCNSWYLLFMWNLWTSCYIWTFSRFFIVAVGTNLLTFIHFFGVWNVIIPLWFALVFVILDVTPTSRMTYRPWAPPRPRMTRGNCPSLFHQRSSLKISCFFT